MQYENKMVKMMEKKKIWWKMTNNMLKISEDIIFDIF